MAKNRKNENVTLLAYIHGFRDAVYDKSQNHALLGGLKRYQRRWYHKGYEDGTRAVDKHVINTYVHLKKVYLQQ